MITVVLFDLDDTLFAHAQAVTDGIVEFSGLPDAGPRWHELEEKHYHRYLAGELDYTEQRRARAREFVDPLVLSDDSADAWFDGYFERYQGAWRLHDDALPCLDALADRRLGMITNGDLTFQTRKIAGLGITERFEHIVASGALGFTKPDPRIFLSACALFDVEPAEALYVGDRLKTDAVGAAGAGLTGVWLDRSGAATADDLRAAAASGVQVISTLAELPALVGRDRPRL
ncbi:MAG: putative hydrolase of the superfamily [Actinomycetota bacterium]|nr:putative hydrolase of the superfamily [Actinomycetota bacterium]MDQ1564476.1 putative hydrolase of the superfamily [Actinomycetota bacterium]